MPSLRELTHNMIVDDIKINVTAGHGGKGMATFSKVKFALGPTGGNGGIGGNIFIEGVADLGALRQFRFKKDSVSNSLDFYLIRFAS